MIARVPDWLALVLTLVLIGAIWWFSSSAPTAVCTPQYHANDGSALYCYGGAVTP